VAAPLRARARSSSRCRGGCRNINTTLQELNRFWVWLCSGACVVVAGSKEKRVGVWLLEL
jgi:hypothetical protein